MKPPIFDASNVHSRAFGFVFVPVYRCSPAIYRAKKRNTKKKSANFGTKVPAKRRKTGSFSAKVAHLCTPLGFPPSELPFHGLIRSVRTSARSLRTSTCRCGRCFPSRHTLATRNAPAAHTGKDVRLELHAPMPEDIPFTDANSGRTQRMIEKQTRKCHKKRTRARVRRFEPRKRARKTSTAFCGMPKDGREMIEQYHSSTQGHVLTSQAAISAREETAQNYYLCATYGNYTH